MKRYLSALLIMVIFFTSCNTKYTNIKNNDVQEKTPSLASQKINSSSSPLTSYNKQSQSNSSSSIIQTSSQKATSSKKASSTIINVISKDIMSYPRITVDTNRVNVPYSTMQEKCLDSSYGFIIKIKVKETYKNVLISRADGGDTASDASELVDPMSYLLTDVLVQNIYYIGKSLDFKEGNTIPIAERCYIGSHSTPYLSQQNTDVVLRIQSATHKLAPNDEYLIFGYKDTDKRMATYGQYCSVGAFEGIYEINQISDQYKQGFFSTVNKDNVLSEYLSKYKAIT
jgi:hypothetical protein